MTTIPIVKGDVHLHVAVAVKVHVEVNDDLKVNDQTWAAFGDAD